MKKRVIAIVLTLIIVFTYMPAAAIAAPAYVDTENHWAKNAINRWSEYYVANGRGNEEFDPEGQMTRAEAAQIFANLLGLNKIADISEFKDVKNDWYKEAIAKCYAAGILNGKGEGKMDPNGKITREEFMTMYARSICISNGIQPEAAKTELTQKGYADTNKVSDWAADAVQTLVDKGFVKGISETELAPQNNINRASVMALLDQSISTYVGKDSTETIVTAKSEGITLIANPNVTKVTGNANIVVIAAGFEKVNSTTGEIAKNDVVIKNAKNVTLLVEESTITVTGKVDTIAVAETAKNLTLDIKSTAIVKTIDNKAENTTVSGGGSVDTVKSSEDVKVETKNTKAENTNETKEIAVTDSKGAETIVETKTGSSSTGTASETIVNKEEKTSSGGGYVPPAHTHTLVTDAAVAATCTTAGKTEGSHCSVCRETLVAQTDIPALGHAMTHQMAQAPTCTEDGTVEYWTCSREDGVYYADEEGTQTLASIAVSKSGHTLVTDAAVAATCTTAGKTEGSHCSVCSETLVAQEEVPALGHNWDDGQCTRCGIYKLDLKFVNTDKYLYRVGNQNSVATSSLFDGTIKELSIENVNGNAAGNYDNGNITFTGTGVVKVTANGSFELLLEVVDGLNATTAQNATKNNVILLNDVSTSNLQVSGGYALYGNGFRVTDTRTSPTPENNQSGYVMINNGTVNNVQFIGYEPKEQNYYNNGHKDIAPAVKVGTGGANIYNCYISGGRYALQADSCDIVMLKTILDGGAVGNAYFVGGNITLEDCVTTISTRNGKKGLGICISSVNGVKLSIKGTFKQYNWATSSDVPSVFSGLISSVYSNETFAASYGGQKYINTGIFFLDSSGANITKTDAQKAISDMTGNSYDYFEKSALSITGCCYTATAETFDEAMLAAPEFIPNNYAIVPAVSFDHTINYKENTGDGTDYCYVENGVVNIQVVKTTDDTAFEWDPYIMTIANKYGNTLSYTVKMNDTEYAKGSKIPFGTEGDYDVEYIYTDPYNFDKDATPYDMDYMQKVKVHVLVVIPEKVVYHPKFSYVGAYHADSKQVTVNNMVYVMPDISSTLTGQFGSKTVGGETIYYPIVEVYGGGKNFYAPAFSAINITDLNNETGTEKYTYNSSSSKWPHNGSASGGYSIVNKQPDDTSAYYGYIVGASANTCPWQYQGVYANGGNGNASTGSKPAYGGLYFSSTGLNSDRAESNQTVEFWYRGDDGVVYRYFIQYHFPAKNTVSVLINSNVGGTVDHARITGLTSMTKLTEEGNNLFADGNVIATATPVSDEYTVKWRNIPTSGIKSHTTVNVDFIKNCTLTIDCGENGTVDKQAVNVLSGTTLTANGNKLMNGNETLATATPNQDYVAEWSIPETAILDDITIELSFKPPIMVTINCANGGSIDNSLFLVPYNSELTADGNDLKFGDKILATVTPNEGYVAKWDIIPTKVTGDTTISVTFVSPVTITITATTNGSVDKKSVQVVPGKKLTENNDELLYDGVKIATATANSGYSFDKWEYSADTITSDTTVTARFKENSSCLVPGTLITMADGTQKPVEEIIVGDMLLTWDFNTGSYSAKPVVFNDSDEATERDVIYATFSDETVIGIISDHGFFDMDLGEYVYIDENAEQYIGHSFIKEDGSIVTLINVEIECEFTECYSPVTFGDLNYYTNGMLSMPGGISGLFNIFDVDTDTMKYEEQQMQKDIQTYGLLDFDDFNDMITEYMYEAFNGRYLNIAIGKGNLTWEYIIYLAERYSPLCG